MGVIMIKLNKQAEKVVEELKDHFKVSSKDQVFKKAISLLDIVAWIQKEGGIIIAKYEYIEKEIIIK